MEIRIRSEYRAEQHYVAIRKKVNRQGLSIELPKLIPEVARWLTGKNVKPAGAPFFNYIDMDGDNFDVEVGFPVAEKMNGDELVKPGKFEAGNYAVATYIGPYSNLYKVHERLAEYALENNIKTTTSTEFYPIDPSIEPDSNKWQTDILAKLDETANKEIETKTIVVNNP